MVGGCFELFETRTSTPLPLLLRGKLERHRLCCQLAAEQLINDIVQLVLSIIKLLLRDDNDTQVASLQ